MKIRAVAFVALLLPLAAVAAAMDIPINAVASFFMDFSFVVRDSRTGAGVLSMTAGAGIASCAGRRAACVVSGTRCRGCGRRNLGLAAVVLGQAADAAQDHGRREDGGEGGNGAGQFRNGAEGTVHRGLLGLAGYRDRCCVVDGCTVRGAPRFSP